MDILQISIAFCPHLIGPVLILVLLVTRSLCWDKTWKTTALHSLQSLQGTEWRLVLVFLGIIPKITRGCTANSSRRKTLWTELFALDGGTVEDSGPFSEASGALSGVSRQ